jgi:hypothetical protein
MASSRYAEGTEVPVSRSRDEVERTLNRYGASEFAYSTREGLVQLAFRIRDTEIAMKIPMPKRNERRFTHSSRGPRTESAQEAEFEQACRQRWRAVALLVKAKLEAVAAGISTVEEEFLADVLVWEAEGPRRRVFDMVQPVLERTRAIETGRG